MSGCVCVNARVWVWIWVWVWIMCSVIVRLCMPWCIWNVCECMSVWIVQVCFRVCVWLYVRVCVRERLCFMFCRAFIKCPPTILVDVRAVTFLTGESKLQKTLRFFIRYDVTWVGSFYYCSKTDNLLNLMKKLQPNIVCFSTSLL